MTNGTSGKNGEGSTKGTSASISDDMTPTPTFSGPDGSRLDAWAPHLSPSQLQASKTFLAELLRFNKKLNLISAPTVPKADAAHILDVIRAWQLIEKRVPAGAFVYDFGTGNGLPGLLSAALAPDRQFRLVDRDQRKMEFCKHVGSVLGLKNVVYSCMDVSDLEPATVRYAMSRGFARVGQSLLLLRKQFAIGGEFFMMKGEGWSRELGELQPQVFSVWKAEMVGEYSLPETPASFVVLSAKKIIE